MALIVNTIGEKPPPATIKFGYRKVIGYFYQNTRISKETSKKRWDCYFFFLAVFFFAEDFVLVVFAFEDLVVFFALEAFGLDFLALAVVFFAAVFTFELFDLLAAFLVLLGAFLLFGLAFAISILL